jgi:hypothetical protein
MSLNGLPYWCCTLGAVLVLSLCSNAQSNRAIIGPTVVCPGVFYSFSYSCDDCLNNNTWVVPVDWSVQTADSELVTSVASSGFIHVFSNLVSSGELVEDSIFVSLSETPQVSLQLPDTICSNQYLGFEYGQPNGGWMVGPGVEDQLIAGPSAGPGWHTYTYTWVSDAGCAGSAQDSIFMINALNLEPLITGADTVCAGSTNLYYVSSQNQSFTYTWQGPANWQIQDQGNAAWITAGSNNGQILVVGSNACEVIATTVIQIAVKFPPQIPQWVNFPTETICAGDTVLIAIDTQDGTHVNWGFGPWPVLNITDTSFRSIVGLGPGAITASRSNECGTSETTAIFLYGDICTAVNEVEENSWFVYPNPASKEIYFSQLPKGNAHYRIMDVSGRVIDTGLIASNRMNIQSINPGVYLLSITDEEITRSVYLVIE